jgi:hypothetical protein
MVARIFSFPKKQLVAKSCRSKKIVAGRWSLVASKKQDANPDTYFFFTSDG